MSNADFERCADFLARMIEKYGSELDLPKPEEREKPAAEAVERSAAIINDVTNG